MTKNTQNIKYHALGELLGGGESLLASLLDSAPAGLVIVDEVGNIIFFNGEAERMFGYPRDEVVGKLVEILLPQRFREAHPGLRRGFVENPTRREMGHERNLFARHKDGREFPIEVGLGYVRSSGKMYISAVLVDISGRKKVEYEREVLIKELKEALDNVKQLKGLFPICASCKKIRDDNGYWNQIESYIRDNSEAEFSHSICPECKEKLYPDLAD